MDVPDDMCRSIVDRGYFVDFKLDQDKQQAAPQPTYVRGDAVQVEPARERPVAVAAASTESLEDGYGELGKRGAGVRRRVAEFNALAN